MTISPELRGHMDAFAADVAADALYVGKHRKDHNAVTVAQVWEGLSLASKGAAIGLRLRRRLAAADSPLPAFHYRLPAVVVAPCSTPGERSGDAGGFDAGVTRPEKQQL